MKKTKHAIMALVALILVSSVVVKVAAVDNAIVFDNGHEDGGAIGKALIAEWRTSTDESKRQPRAEVFYVPYQIVVREKAKIPFHQYVFTFALGALAALALLCIVHAARVWYQRRT